MPISFHAARSIPTAAKAAIRLVTSETVDAGALFPPVGALRAVAARVAAAVVREARGSGVGDEIPDAEVERRVEEAMWTPRYPRLIPPD